MPLDLKHYDDVVARAETIAVHLGGTKNRPGILEKLEGSGSQPGLIDRVYAAGSRLEELLDREDVLIRLFTPGEGQDRYLSFLADRLGEIIASESERAIRPALTKSDASLQEVVVLLKRVSEEVQGIGAHLKAFDEALDEEFHQVKSRNEAAVEGLQEVADHLASLKKADLTQFQVDLQTCFEEVATEVLGEALKNSNEWLAKTMEENRQGYVDRLVKELEGQNIVMSDRLRNSRAELAKAVEGTTYMDALKKLQNELTDAIAARTAVTAERDALKRQQAQPEPAVKQPHADMRLLAGVGVASAAVTAGALYAMFGPF